MTVMYPVLHHHTNKKRTTFKTIMVYSHRSESFHDSRLGVGDGSWQDSLPKGEENEQHQTKQLTEKASWCFTSQVTFLMKAAEN